jgi:5'-nucleotidase (lipoprotein e(P4) family)
VRWRALGLALSLAACGPRVPPRTAPRVASLPGAVHWVRSSVEYRALCLQVYGLATRAVEAAAATRAPHAWGVVLDADETVLDNSLYQKQLAAEGHGYTEASWQAWVAQREAGLVPGARAFLRAVRSAGGVVAIVTNRAATSCGDTRANLDALSVPYDQVLCKPDGGPPEKDTRFAELAKSVEVLAYVGDNIRDFPGRSQADRTKPDDAFAAFGTRFFLLPNPMYGSWEQNEEE